MQSINIYCKSYWKDLDRATVLANSVAANNKDAIPFYISVPKDDLSLFKSKIGERAIIVSDEEIYSHRLQESWVSQQIVKSNFWKLGTCQNYCMIDSDSYFIRPFYVNDFIVEGTDDAPYTVMHEQKDLFSWTSNKSQLLGFDPMEAFRECRKQVMDVFDRKGRYYDFGPGPIIWSSKVWRSLEEKYTYPNGLKFSDLIKLVQSEFSWYGEWLLTDKTIPIYPIEPMFKFFHYPQQYVDAKNQGYTEQNWSQVYMGITMQSNWGAPLKY
jgi:hypothetical protein